MWLTGSSFSTFNVFHKWIGRVCVAHAFIHSVTYTMIYWDDAEEGGIKAMNEAYVFKWRTLAAHCWLRSQLSRDLSSLGSGGHSGRMYHPLSRHACVPAVCLWNIPTPPYLSCHRVHRWMLLPRSSHRLRHLPALDLRWYCNLGIRSFYSPRADGGVQLQMVTI